jgi:hypothetical protein
LAARIATLARAHAFEKARKREREKKVAAAEHAAAWWMDESVQRSEGKRIDNCTLHGRYPHGI